MTKKEAIAALRKIQENTDEEIAHGDADDVLCEFIEELGYPEIVEEYNKIDKWYA